MQFKESFYIRKYQEKGGLPSRHLSWEMSSHLNRSKNVNCLLAKAATQFPSHFLSSQLEPAGTQTCGGPESHRVSLSSCSHLCPTTTPALLALQSPHYSSPVGLPPQVPPSLVTAMDVPETQQPSKARLILRKRFRLSVAHWDPQNFCSGFLPFTFTTSNPAFPSTLACLCAPPHLAQPASPLWHLLHLEKSFCLS